MGIEDIKRALSGGSPAKESEKRTEKPALPLAKEEKKDTSILGGESFIKKDSFEHRLRDSKYFKSAGLGGSERLEIWKKLSGNRGQFNLGDLKKMKTQLNLGGQGSYRSLSHKDREKGKRLLKGISGE